MSSAIAGRTETGKGLLLQAAGISWMSVIGLALLIGALGFTPLLTAFVYLRNCVRALKATAWNRTVTKIAILLLAGAIVAIAPPAVIQWQVRKNVAQAIDELLNERATESATIRLSILSVVTDLDPIVRAYLREPDPSRKARLAEAYKRIAGQAIEDRVNILMD